MDQTTKNKLRIDKYLWCVRFFKTRTLATDACNAGKVLLNGQMVKPSREMQVGDKIEMKEPPIMKTYKVIALLNNRVSAKLVPEYIENLTPPEEIEKLQAIKSNYYVRRDKGLGRPTKKDRRDFDEFYDF